MISMPQIQLACDICDKRVEVEIEQSYIGNSSDFYFDADEWMEEHGWRRLENAPDQREIAWPDHPEVSE